MRPRILVAGGCHVIGYPIGEQYSFVAIMRNLLATQGIAIELTAISHLPIKHVKRLIDAVDASTPDVVVLQLGNYETNITFRNRLLQLLGLKPHRGSDAHKSLPGNMQYCRTWLWRMKCFLKLALDTGLGHSLVDSGEICLNLRVMFDALVQRGPKHVIVMGPLPCADPLYMRYRRRLAPVFEEEAQSRGFVYLPVMTAGLTAQFAGWFVDATHLNDVGQTRLAETLTEALLGLLGKHTTAATERKSNYAEV